MSAEFSRRAPVRQFFQSLRQSHDTSAPEFPETTDAQHLQEPPQKHRGLRIKLGRRNVIAAGAGVLASVGTTLFLEKLGILHIKPLESLGNLLTTASEVNDAHSILSETLDEVPKESVILGNIYKPKGTFDLDSANSDLEKRALISRTTVEIGDSDGFINGDSLNKTVGDVTAKAIMADSFAPQREELGIGTWVNVPAEEIGAPSGFGYAGEQRQYGALTQLRSTKVRRALLEGPEEKELDVYLNFNDLRYLITDSAQLAKYFAVFDHLKNMTKKDINTFKKLKAEFEKISRSYGTHIADIILEVAEMNEYRRSRGLPEIEIEFMYGINLGDADRIPAQVIQGNAAGDGIIQQVDGYPDRGYIAPGDIPYGHEMAYAATAAIYTQLNFWLPYMEDVLTSSGMQAPHVETVVLYDLSKKKEIDGNPLFFVDGHFGVYGIIEFAKRKLKKYKKRDNQGKIVNLGDVVPVLEAYTQPIHTPKNKAA